MEVLPDFNPHDLEHEPIGAPPGEVLSEIETALGGTDDSLSELDRLDPEVKLDRELYEELLLHYLTRYGSGVDGWYKKARGSKPNATSINNELAADTGIFVDTLRTVIGVCLEKGRVEVERNHADHPLSITNIRALEGGHQAANDFAATQPDKQAAIEAFLLHYKQENVLFIRNEISNELVILGRQPYSFETLSSLTSITELNVRIARLRTEQAKLELAIQKQESARRKL